MAISNNSGNTTITGTTIVQDLLVDGTTENTINIKGKNIIIADKNLNDSNINGSGLKLKGDTDKIFLWYASDGGKFACSEHINLYNGNTYMIGNEKMVENNLGIEVSKLDKKDGPFVELPIIERSKYLGVRACSNFLLASKLKKDLDDFGLKSVYFDIDLKLLPILANMEQEGNL